MILVQDVMVVARCGQGSGITSMTLHVTLLFLIHVETTDLVRVSPLGTDIATVLTHSRPLVEA